MRVFKLLSKKKWLRVKKMVLKMHQRLAIRAKFYNKVDFFDQLIITRKSKKRRRSVRRVLKKFYKKKKFNTSKKGFYRRLKKVGVKSKITD